MLYMRAGGLQTVQVCCRDGFLQVSRPWQCRECLPQEADCLWLVVRAKKALRIELELQVPPP